MLPAWPMRWQRERQIDPSLSVRSPNSRKESSLSAPNRRFSKPINDTDQTAGRSALEERDVFIYLKRQL